MSKIIQIAASNDALYALDDQGNVFVYEIHGDNGWQWGDIRTPVSDEINEPEDSIVDIIKEHARGIRLAPLRDEAIEGYGMSPATFHRALKNLKDAEAISQVDGEYFLADLGPKAPKP